MSHLCVNLFLIIILMNIHSVLHVHLFSILHVSLNCVVICHVLIQYTHLFLICLRCMIERPSLLYHHTNVILRVVV